MHGLSQWAVELPNRHRRPGAYATRAGPYRRATQQHLANSDRTSAAWPLLPVNGGSLRNGDGWCGRPAGLRQFFALLTIALQSLRCARRLWDYLSIALAACQRAIKVAFHYLPGIRWPWLAPPSRTAKGRKALERPHASRAFLFPGRGVAAPGAWLSRPCRLRCEAFRFLPFAGHPGRGIGIDRRFPRRSHPPCAAGNAFRAV